MSEVLAVQGLTKHYPAFTLEDVSFTLRPGVITGIPGVDLVLLEKFLDA